MKKPDWLSCLAVYTSNVMGGFFLLFDVTMDISDGKFTSGKAGIYILLT